jgi:group I intron endonuclease
MYVGSTSNISKRWSRHRQELSDGTHRNKHLQAAWAKYGAEAFDWRILELCPAEVRIEREQHYIDHHDLTDPSKGFNKAAQAGVSYGGVGRQWTDEQRAAASAYWKQRRPAGWLPAARRAEGEGRDPSKVCPQGHVKDGTYTKKRHNGSVKVLCQECERKAARERERKKRGIPLDHPRGKHFNRRG